MEINFNEKTVDQVSSLMADYMKQAQKREDLGLPILDEEIFSHELSFKIGGVDVEIESSKAHGAIIDSLIDGEFFEDAPEQLFLVAKAMVEGLEENLDRYKHLATLAYALVGNKIKGTKSYQDIMREHRDQARVQQMIEEWGNEDGDDD